MNKQTDEQTNYKQTNQKSTINQKTNKQMMNEWTTNNQTITDKWWMNKQSTMRNEQTNEVQTINKQTNKWWTNEQQTDKQTIMTEQLMNKQWTMRNEQTNKLGWVMGSVCLKLELLMLSEYGRLYQIVIIIGWVIIGTNIPLHSSIALFWHCLRCVRIKIF